ncbi:MAG: Gfo/Idh/MocA family oxidoreductase [Clostridia bacterium]|nr:Gfo/Idh/MocA family oxidoreductase [Clostridia bacterium]
MDIVRIGIIGVGGIANAAHIPAYLKNPHAQIVALCDIDAKRAEAAKKKFFKDAAVYEDYMDLLADETIDAVDICTPNYLHSEIAVEAFRAGKHVLCEKPDAVSVDEAEKMYAASLDAGKILMVIRNNRFNLNSQYLKKFIEKDRMGDIYVARAVWRRRRGIPGKGGWFTTKELSGGGPLIDLGVHMIDLTWWLMGCPEVEAVTGNTFCKFADNDAKDSPNADFGDRVENGTFDVEDLAIGTIRFRNGAVMQFEVSWASNIEKEERYVELYGTRAGAYWDGSRSVIYYEAPDGKQKSNSVDRNEIITDHAHNIGNFIDAVRGKAEPCYQPQQGVEMIKILSAIYTSAENGGKEVRF